MSEDFYVVPAPSPVRVEKVCVLEGMPTRVVDGLVDGELWSWTEEWRGGAWVRSFISVGEVMKALPASESKLLQAVRR